MSKPNDKPKVSAGTLKTAGRLMKYVTGPYKVQFIIVLICILMTSISSIAVSLSLRFLLDDYILPLVGQQDPNFSELYKAMAVLACIFILGVIASFIYNRMMVVIGQGVLKKVRDEMFEHMQTLPIRYFDQNTNGSIMSLYTNDTDTLRQMINQSIPQVLMSSFTIVVTFISMLLLSPILTALAVLVILLMIVVARYVGGNSGKYFIQQIDLADVTGYVEEQMNGQRVIKVFNHEKRTEEDFDRLNERLYESASSAHTFASMMGPIIGNMGNLQFVLTAIFGGVLSVAGIGGITLGVMASYLQFTRSFTQPFMQIAQQFNSIIMALAGAERIFHMIDEKPEVDDGYVTLVNAKRNPDGSLTECQERLENEDILVQLKETRLQAEISLENLMVEIQELVHENARKSQDQQKYRAKFNKFVQQIDEQKKRMAVLKAEELKLVGMREKLHRFIETLKNCKDATVFKEQEWNNLVERAVVKTESLDFEFKNGERIKITI